MYQSLENDTKSYMQYRIKGSLQTVIRMKPGCVPKKCKDLSGVYNYINNGKPLPTEQQRLEECAVESAETNSVSLDTNLGPVIYEDSLSETSDTMADEIDIEEHDVLDNPAIRNIFPDITVIKQEIDSYEDGSEIVNEYQLSNSLQVASDINESQNISLKEENDMLNNPYDNSSNSNNQSTKIILGSKPKRKLDYTEFEENVNSYELKLQLLDMKPYLERSERFCRQCLILFPNKQSFEIHVNEFHSFIEQKIRVVEQIRVGDQKASVIDQKDRVIDQKDRVIDQKDRVIEQKNRVIEQKNTVFKQQNKKTPIYCAKCNIKFTVHASLMRHCRNFHKEKQNKINMAKKVETTMQRLKKSEPNGSHVCFHCKKEFLTQQSLIQHLYSVIQLKTHWCLFCSKKFTNKTDFEHHMLGHKEKKVTVEDCPNNAHEDVNHSDVELLEESQPDKDLSESCRINLRETEMEKDVAVDKKKKKEALDTNVDFYRCHICHHYFKELKHCLEHLAIEHKITGYTVKPVKFDSFCQLCQRNYNDISVYNCHVSLFHNSDIDQRKTNASQLTRSLGTNMKDECLLLKSTLFRCTKCDIHFLSAEVARNHKDHMEMLSHWKCKKCIKFFKKEDEWRHTKQHVFPNLMVYDLCPDSHYLVLFNCLKCTVHFDENGFVEHYSKCCESETPSAVYCKYCDLLIDESIGKSHKASHEIENIKFDNITIVNSNVITINNNKNQQPVKLQYNQVSKVRKSANNIKHERKQKELRIKRDGSSKDAEKTMKRNWNSLCELTYCGTCKLFLINRFTRNIHIKGRCRNLRKCVCKVCGLVFPSQHYKTHKKLHYKLKTCNLQNFEFYNFNGKLISPPIPEYPKCEKCDLVSISRPAGCHDCNKVDYLTCNLCDMRLTEEAFKLHMLFHNFTKIRSADKHNNASERLSSEWNLDEEKTAKLTENLLYECKNCNINVDTYDKAVEHSQGHYSGEWKNVETVKCQFCNKIFDKTCYEKHQKYHLSHSDTINSRIFYFDSVYLTSENNIWLKHVFGRLSETQINAIICKSVYKSECRIKMKVIQDGPPNFTVYKCDKCCSYIDESSLYKHADNSCFKLRKHHCSICNLPFISSFARTQHEQIHTDPNIGWKSYRNYRIVIFNKQEDNKINKLLYNRSQYYVLYRCRNCHASVDEMQTRNHKCSQRLKCCKLCGLLIYHDHYESHNKRHKELTNFTQNKIKVILFGDSLKNPTGENQTTDEFSGIVCDYTFYCCERCKVTLKTVHPPTKHICSSTAVKTKCQECNLYFYTSTLKRHNKLHDDDLEFVRKNMRIIMFDLTESVESSSKDVETTQTVDTKSIELGDEKQSADPESEKSNLENEIVEKRAKIYKCNCGLHFLNRVSMLFHSKTCSSKIRTSKQNCFKCGLLFTSKSLFSHLLIHHGNQNQKYLFDIVDCTAVLNGSTIEESI
ncbi:zinc finger protein Xfin-like isoform X2 [Pectinophora gossypiella]|uniref:zinc finger protein Xfin-like isoform X2 n=1 Tax=Pectinophora gossypiella TaxID=13191 RepID=UPI00214E7F3F|nr:zinc finger protein Xfin-like isoform X2 [Pectinophora gossypiella]